MTFNLMRPTWWRITDAALHTPGSRAWRSGSPLHYEEHAVWLLRWEAAAAFVRGTRWPANGASDLESDVEADADVAGALCPECEDASVTDRHGDLPTKSNDDL